MPALPNKILLNLPEGNLFLNFQIPNLRYGTIHQLPTDEPLHPHLIDMYEPTGVDIAGAFIGLHGGGATKEQFAQQLFIKIGGGPPTHFNTRWGILKRAFSVCFLPQGQHCHALNEEPQPAPGIISQFNPNGVNSVSAKFPGGLPSWDNKDQLSGADDKQFVKDAVVWLVARYGQIVIGLAGHSSGGIMTQRIWAEYEAGYPLVYGTLCGPLSDYYLTQPTPAVVKPMLNWYGDQDINLSVYPDFYSPTWVQSKNFNAIDVSFPNPSIRIGDWVQLQTRVNAYNVYKSRPVETITREGTAFGPGSQGTNRTYEYCDGKFKVIENSLSAHPAGQIQGYIGLDFLAQFLSFAFTNFHG